MQLWFETAVVAVMMRVTQSTCRRTDYVREVLSSAEEHKEIGNVRFKTGRWDAAMETPSYESPGMPTPATRNIVGTSELAFSSPAVGGTV